MVTAVDFSIISDQETIADIGPKSSLQLRIVLFSNHWCSIGARVLNNNPLSTVKSSKTAENHFTENVFSMVFRHSEQPNMWFYLSDYVVRDYH